MWIATDKFTSIFFLPRNDDSNLVLCYPSGLPQVMDGDLHAPGQRGHVEHEVGGVGAPGPGPTGLPPGAHADALAPRRAPHPGQCAPLRPGGRPPDQAALTRAGGGGGGPELVMRG